MMMCDGYCGRDLPSNFLKPVDQQRRDGNLVTVHTLQLCTDCRRTMKARGII
jgi:hypothetical protein